MLQLTRLCFVACAVASFLTLISVDAVAQETEQGPPTVTGDVSKFLGDDLPAPPVGYGGMQAAGQALATGKVQMAPLMKKFPNVVSKRNIAFHKGSGKTLRLDMYGPKGLDHAVPGIVLIHGGGWAAGDKADYQYYGQYFASKGYVVASISYRFSQTAPFPAAVEDCKAAVRWMRSNAKKWNIDPERIAVAGGSAGGHLSLMVGLTNDDEFTGVIADDAQSSRVSAIVSLYGPTDLSTDFVQTNQVAAKLVSNFVGAAYLRAPEKYKSASPINYVDKDDPPILILHGTADQIVPVGQSDALAKKLTEVGVPYVYDRLPNWSHGMDITAPVNARCCLFMERFFAKVFEEQERSK